MKNVEKVPFISPPRGETLRQGIIALIGRGEYSAKEISAEIGIREKEVYDHLEHIKRSVGKAFIVTPAKCRKCGFVFEEREKLAKPGRCPVCRYQTIEAPLFKINKGY